jgi:hypothetical protein
MRADKVMYFKGEPEGTVFHNMPTPDLIRLLYEDLLFDEVIPPALNEALHRLEASCET